eukprot:5349565-Pyramimonas_sp.AAC.2
MICTLGPKCQHVYVVRPALEISVSTKRTHVCGDYHVVLCSYPSLDGCPRLTSSQRVEGLRGA